MAKVRCEYCGNYIDETQQTCPSCGAVNPAYQRTAHDTPRTIQELQSWYRARNLPPEEVTRFFIGRDVREPRAFGIYESGGKYIVYKNKANGERAIRYEGTDQAYAVNELYLKLKEEILRQKSHNLRRSASGGGTRFGGGRSGGRGSGRGKNRLPLFIIVLLGIVILNVAAAAVSLGNSSFRWKPTPSQGYYREGDDLYYFPRSSVYEDGEYRYYWWKYDPAREDWYRWQTVEDMDVYPAPITDQTAFSYSLPFPDLSYPAEQYAITRSHAYIDLHPVKPSNDYYSYGGHTYFFLDDPYGGSYGDYDRTGWYLYDEEADSWEYYADYDDKEKLGEDLWYNAESYHLQDYDKANWDTSFYDTEFYQDYEEANQAYYRDLEERRNDSDDDNNWNWDNDDDYDWDDDWDWDDGGDWDSDW